MRVLDSELGFDYSGEGGGGNNDDNNDDVVVNNASILTEVEDIYRPFKPKKRTRATIAKEKGLEPLAKIILKQSKKEKEKVVSLGDTTFLL